MHRDLRFLERFCVQTNFFKTATRMILDSRGDNSVDLFRRILAVTHREGGAATQYSNIYDLKARVVDLYHFRNPLSRFE